MGFDIWAATIIKFSMVIIVCRYASADFFSSPTAACAYGAGHMSQASGSEQRNDAAIIGQSDNTLH